MKIMILLAMMDVLIFCAYWILFVKAGIERIIGYKRNY